ncbi:MAG: BamA/TamA family outer membrane protein [Deltaproteobacteria bacterium]|nr:BamA/TamA family outer membrane protein [Deltaproteobacteria bacterium]
MIELLLALWMCAVARAEVPPEQAGRPIEGVELRPELVGVLRPEEIGVRSGARLGRALVRGVITRLLETGRLVEVEVSTRWVDGRLVLTVGGTPRLIASRIDVAGNRLLDDEQIRRVIGVETGGEIRRDGLLAIRDALERAYAERGYGAARADVGVRETDDPTRVVLRIEIEEGPPARIAELLFETPVWLPDEVDLDDLYDVEAGDILDHVALRDAQRRLETRLRRRGFLEAQVGDRRIAFGAPGIVVTVPIAPGPRFRTVLRGYAPLPRDVVEQALGTSEEQLVGEAARRTAEQRVREAAQRHGFLRAQVAIRRRPLTERSAELVVALVLGPQVRVRAIRFPGAVHYEPDLLREQIYSYLEEDLPGGDLFQPVDVNVVDALGLGGSYGRAPTTAVARPLVVRPRDVYYVPTYREALRHLQELFRAEGYLAATVGPARVVERSPTEIDIEIPVTPGPRTTLYDVTVERNEHVLTHEILETTGLSRGTPLSYRALEEARIRIQDLYQDRGYLFVRVDPRLRFSDDRTRATVSFEVVEGYRVRVGRVIVRGAERTSHALIRERLRLRPGGLYRPALARESQERLLELGVFIGVTVGPSDPDLPERVKPVLVQVTERPLQYLDTTFGFATGEGLRGSIEYGYRNLFGYALSLRLRGQLGYQVYFADETVEQRFRRLTVGNQLERQLTVGLLLPHMPAIGYLRTALDFVHLRENERDFGFDKNAVVLTLSSTLLKRLFLQMAVSLENNTIGFFESQSLAEYLQMTMDSRIRRLLLVPEGESTITSVRPSVSLDLRDNAFTPTRGLFASASLEWVRSVATAPADEGDPEFFSDFFKLGLSTSGYLPLGRGIVLAAQLRIGRIFHLQQRSRTYPNRLFFLGGVDSLRGFQQDELIPQDIADEIAASEGELDPDSVLRGGDTYLLGRTELRVPLTGFLHAGLFLEAGNLWVNTDAFAPFDLRPTGGLGARFATPAGFIALDYGINLLRRRELGEGFGALHFSIGLF